MRYKSIAIMLGCLLSTQAGATAFTNGSFENGTFVPDANNTDDLAVGSTAMTGWSVYNTSVSWINSANPFHNSNPSDGNYFLDLTSYHDNGVFGGVSQTFDTIAGATYLLTFDLGDSIFYNGGQRAGVMANVADQSATFVSANTGDAGNGSVWMTQTLQFLATSSSTTLSLIGTQGVQFVGVDNVSVALVSAPAAAVPEAATWAMMLTGFGMIGGAARYRRRMTQVAYA